MEIKKSTGIHGVIVVPRRKICDDRGAIFHMLRNDDPEFKEFGEIYFSKVYPDVVKAWHHHTKMILNYFVVVGAVRMALFDDREDSPTRGMHQDVFLDESDSKLVVVPSRVWNGFKGIGTVPAIIANCASIPHDPTEISRKPHDDPYFKYDWSQRHG